MKRTGNKRFKYGIWQKTLSFIAFPCIMIGLFVSIYAVISYRNIIRDEVEDKLATASYGATIISESLGMKADNMKDQINTFAKQSGVEITIFQGDVRAVTSIDGALGTKMDAGVKETLMKTGDKYFSTDANVNGETYYGFYIPYISNGDLQGAVFAGVPQKDATELIASKVRNLLLCIVGIALAFMLLAAVQIRKLIKKLFISLSLVEQLHANNLVVAYNDRFKKNRDEYEEIYNSTYEFAGSLHGIITDIRDASENLREISVDLNGNASIASNSTEEIAKAVENVASGAQNQAEDTQNAVRSVSNMGENIEHIASNTTALADTAAKMNEAKKAVVETLDVLTGTNNDTMQDVKAVNEQITLTNESIHAIFEALNLIQDIATETNLLSLNASIEAARAGEVGKGFAVVAEQIKQLADQSSESSKEISENLNDLLSNYQLIIKKMDQTTENIHDQNEKLIETKNNFVTLENGIDHTNEQIKVINTMVDRLNQERDAISDVILNLSAVSEENAASTQEMMASIEELNSVVGVVDNKAGGLTELSAKLADQVGIFNI